MVICYALLCCIQIQTHNPWCLIESFGRSSISEAEPLSRPLRCCHLDAWLRHSSPDMLNKPDFSQLWKPRNVRTGSNRNRGTLLERLPKSSNSSTSYLTQQLRLSRLLQYLSLPGNCLAQEGFCASMQQHWFISCNMLTNMLERNMHGTPDQTPLLGVSDGLDGLLNFLLLARMVGKWERTSAENDSYTKMLEAFLFSKEEHDSNFNSTFQVDLLWERRERLLPPLWVDFRKHQQSTNEKGHGNMWRFARVLLLADFPRPLAFQLLPDSAEKWNRAFRCIAWSSALWVFELCFIVIASVHILFKHQSSAMGGID